MSFSGKLSILLWVAVFALLLVGPTRAQEATPEATSAPGVTVNVEQPAAAPAPPLELGSVALLLIGGFIGTLAAGVPALVALTHMSKAQKDMAEKLFLSQPPAAVEKERAVIDVLDKAVEIFGRVLVVVKEVTDGQPNSDPPTPASGTPSP